jgi:hypothetical protein
MRLQPRKARAGYLNSVEFLLYMPIVALTFLAVVQFAQVLAAEARLAGASREGARVAASGGDCEQITNAVFAGLLPAERSLVSVETNATNADGSPASLTPGSDVVVRVSAPTSSIVKSPLLMVTFNNQVLVGQTVMRKE